MDALGWRAPPATRVSGILRLGGTLLICSSVIGLIALAALTAAPEPSAGPRSAIETAFAELGVTILTGVSAPAAAGPNFMENHEAAPIIPAPSDDDPAEITRLAIPAIDLAADVVPANLVQQHGGLTWEVPAFRVGHAQGTAGAGRLGNAILLGHVTSLRSGNVFADLDRADIGQLVQVFADDAEFDYTIVSKQHVSREDRGVTDPGAARAVSLVTCTGMWLPTIWDYTERLVVRAELNQGQTHDR